VLRWLGFSIWLHYLRRITARNSCLQNMRLLGCMLLIYSEQVLPELSCTIVRHLDSDTSSQQQKTVIKVGGLICKICDYSSIRRSFIEIIFVVYGLKGASGLRDLIHANQQCTIVRKIPYILSYLSPSDHAQIPAYVFVSTKS
jgi:hypothetical protein